MKRIPRTVALIGVLMALVAAPASAAPDAHASATCSDFSNQAAAQRAKNTRDADGDGIYCESLPCPCSTSTGGGSGTSPPVLHPRRRVIVAVCQRSRLPDRRARCTPGTVFSRVTARQVCTPGYSARVRHVSSRTRALVFARYGVTYHPRGAYEVDHLIPLELGGSNSVHNLFPEAAKPRPGFHQKDLLENAMHRMVCNGEMTLRQAQHEIKTNWVRAYHRYVV